MIRVVIGRKDDHIRSFKVSGHAGYDDYGKDIICSAISMLAINTVNSLQYIAGETLFTEQNEDGMLKASFDHCPNEAADVLLRSFELGVQGVIDQYGSEFVSLMYETDK